MTNHPQMMLLILRNFSARISKTTCLHFYNRLIYCTYLLNIYIYIYVDIDFAIDFDFDVDIDIVILKIICIYIYIKLVITYYFLKQLAVIHIPHNFQMIPQNCFALPSLWSQKKQSPRKTFKC